MSKLFHVQQAMDIRDVPKILNNIYAEYHKAFNYLVGRFKWDENYDVRIAYLKVFAERIHQYYLSSLFLKDNLTQNEWWYKNFNLKEDEVGSIKSSKITHFDQQLREDILLKTYIEVESFIKTIYSKISNQPYISKTIDISTVYNEVFQACLLPDEYKNFIKILYNIKHVLFNDGMHKFEDEDITYKEKEFLFTKDYLLPVEYVTWKYIEFYLIEIKNLILAIVESKNISEIKEFSASSLNVNFISSEELNKADEKTINQAVENLSNLNLKTVKDDQVILNEITKLGYIPYLFNIFHPGKPIYRARPNDGKEFSKVEELSYLPADKNKIYKRASTPTNTMFYGAISNEVSPEFMTLDESVVLTCEASNLFRNRDTIENGIEIITFGRWAVTKDIPLLAITQHAEYDDKSKWIEKYRKDYLRFTRQFPSIRNQIINATDFIADEFAKVVNDGENYDYMISAVFTELIMNNAKTLGLPVGGILYPSKQAEGSGLCVAIHPDWVDECMELEGVLEVKNYKKGKQYLTNNLRQCYVKPGSESFALKEITDPKFRSSEEEIQMILDGKIKINNIREM